MDPHDAKLLDLGLEVTKRCLATVGPASDWSATARGHGQHVGDVVADEAALRVLLDAGVEVFSEESGSSGPAGDVVAVLDPIDGSANAARGIPFFASALAFVVAGVPRIAVVRGFGGIGVFTAVRGEGAWHDGSPIQVTRVTDPRDAIVFVNGYPRRHLGWRQMRALGSAALELCLMAAGVGDAFIDCSDGLAVWDVLAASLIVAEAGGSVRGVSLERPLLDTSRARVLAAGSGALLDAFAERLAT